jgi:hypothetical protein
MPLGLKVEGASAIRLSRLCQIVREMRTKRYAALSLANDDTRPQSNELTRAPPELVYHFCL